MLLRRLSKHDRSEFRWDLAFACSLLFWYVKERWFCTAVNSDGAVYLSCAYEILLGRRMFVDVFEVNPPLIAWLSTIPASLAQLRALTYRESYIAWVIGTAALSLLLLLAILKQMRAGWKDRSVIGSAATGLILFFGLDSNYHFGQREQLFTLTYLPLFFMRSLSGDVAHRPRALTAWAVGFYAGVGAMLKPYLILIPLLVEVVVLAASRNCNLLNWQNAGLLSATVLYGFAITALDPQAAVNFWQLHVPLVMTYYTPGHANLLSLSLLKPAGILAVAIPLSLVVAWSLRARLLLMPALLAWMTAAYAVYLIQGKGWSYHAVPLFGGAVLVWGATLAIVAERCIRAKHRPVNNTFFFEKKSAMSVCLILFSVFTVGSLAQIPAIKPELRAQYADLEDYLERLTKAGDAVAFICHDHRFVMELLLERNLRQGWRYAWGYPVWFLERFPDRSPVELQRDWHALFLEIRHDVQTRRPAVIFLEKQMTGSNRRISIAEQMEQLGYQHSLLSGYKHAGELLLRNSGKSYLLLVYARE